MTAEYAVALPGHIQMKVNQKPLVVYNYATPPRFRANPVAKSNLVM
jgi:hypothetical protein